MGGRGRRITSFGTAWEKVVVRPCLKNRNWNKEVKDLYTTH
jgi:hypothetical protein